MRKIKTFFFGRLFPCILLSVPFVAITVFIAVCLPRALGAFAVSERLFSLVTALYVINSPATAEVKCGKCALLLLLPWTGAAVCLLYRTPKPHCVRPVSAVTLFEDETFNRLATLAAAHSPLDACFAQSAEYFPTGNDMYGRLLADLSNAKHSILLEYYIIERGAFWNAVLEILKQKAAVGVDVRVCYDDFGCALTLPKRYCKELTRSGIKAQNFCPLRALPSARVNHRDHRKLLVIDGEIAYTGGINLADEYIGAKLRFGNWKDTAIRLSGAPARRFAALFAGGAPEYESAPPQGEIACIPFCDSPDPDGGATLALFARLAACAKNTLYLTTPYLAPDEGFIKALVLAAQTGVDVKVMIPHIPDKRAAFTLTRRYARRLEKSGVAVREYTAGFLHAKNIVADGKYLSISSCNLDYRSFHLQYECGALLHDGELAKSVESDFLADWQSSTPVPRATCPERLLGAVLQLFVPFF